jgi:glycosyltransferase involved in cell wall biosynthesis
MRITQVMISRRFGGAERLFVDLSLELAARGHAVQTIVDARFTHRHLLEGVAGVRAETVRIIFRPDLLAARRIGRLIASFQTEVVHAHLGRGIRMAGKSAVPLGIPLVATAHLDGEARDYRRASLVIALTEGQRRRLSDSGTLSSPCEVVPNFSRLAPVAAVQQRHADGGPSRLLALGRFDERDKGFDVLLQAMSMLHRQGVSARLMLAGDGRDRQSLLRRRAELGLEGIVDMPGWIEDVRSAMAGADALVLSSRRETFGLVLLEAMAMGLAIVSTRCDGAAEVVDEGCAFLAEPGDAESLAGAMRAVVSDPAGRQARARRGLERYQTRFCADRVVPRIAEAYRRAVGTEASS